LCSKTGELGIQILSMGKTTQRKDSADTWESSTAYPDSALLAPLPQVPQVDTGSPTISKAAGYVFAYDGSCEGTSYGLLPNSKRTLYIQNGAYFAKFGIVSIQSKQWGIIPYYAFIISIKFRYVLNDSNDLVGQSSSVPPLPRKRIEPRFGARIEHELYNPLGVKFRREPGRFEPAVTAPRKR
jgi:hypothetical protein